MKLKMIFYDNYAVTNCLSGLKRLICRSSTSYHLIKAGERRRTTPPSGYLPLIAHCAKRRLSLNAYDTGTVDTG